MRDASPSTDDVVDPTAGALENNAANDLAPDDESPDNEAEKDNDLQPLSESPGVTRMCLLILTILAVLYTAYFAKAVLMPITLAVVISIVLRPIVAGLRKLGVPRGVSAALLLVGVLCGFAAGFFFLTEPAKEWVAKAPETLSEVQSRFRDAAESLALLQQAKERVDEITAVPGEEKPVAVRLEQPALTSQLLNTTGSYAASVAIASSLLFFLLASGDRFVEKTVEVIPTWEAKWDVVLIIRDIEKKISLYLGAITLINAGLGVTIGLGLWALGMPNPILWGALAGLLNFIPFAGLAIGTAMVGLTAIVTFESLSYALLAPAIYLTANGIEANFVTPAILGRSIDLNPVMILLAVFLGGWIWGVTGIFLAVPLLLIARIVCEHYDSLNPVAIYLTS